MDIANSVQKVKQYCNSLTQYSRRLSREVFVGDVPLGGHNPIRVQSMTTVDTMDTAGSIAESIRMVEAGCEYIRITAPSLKEAKNLEEIKKGLRNRGYTVPLIADIHFTPNAAELAARIVEKVRINPGNYVDKKKFEIIEYSDIQYTEEVGRIRDKFVPLIKICKEYGTAMRIGTNHGSLSDRILSRYGDTPLGMVESALEFLRICEEQNYYNIVLSMKASNTQVMVQAYRMLVQKLAEENLQPYPLHLGVTEAGEAEDGRIKSAVGIGALLEDGLGDTVRVSLTEPPEAEAPVAAALVNRYQHRLPHQPISGLVNNPINPYQYHRRQTAEVESFGGHQVPRVIADFSKRAIADIKDLRAVGHFYLPEPDKWRMNDLGADYIYSGSKPVPFMLPNGLREILDASAWQHNGMQGIQYPLFTPGRVGELHSFHPKMNFIELRDTDATEAVKQLLNNGTPWVILLRTENKHAMAALRRFIFWLLNNNLSMPVVVQREYQSLTADELQLYASTDVGGLLLDGLGDGIMLSANLNEAGQPALEELGSLNNLAFGILQAARTRMTKTEYISCPSCGRTLFDLPETTAMIRKRTDHLKGVKIGIMGCIVNGPGEMADADYGYVGSGKGKITLYRGQEVVKRNVPSVRAVDELIEIIKEDGIWQEAASVY